jgi:hypothetical protein
VSAVLAQHELAVHDCDQTDRVLLHEFIHGPLDAAVPPTAFRVVITADVPSARGLHEGKPQIRSDEFVEVIAVNVDLVEVRVRKGAQRLVRWRAVNANASRAHINATLTPLAERNPAAALTEAPRSIGYRDVDTAL